MQPVYLRMTLSPQLGMSESITLWHFKPPLLILTFTNAVSSPQTIRDWNSLTDTLLSAAEGAEDSVAKFTSLVRAKANFPHHRSW